MNSYYTIKDVDIKEEVLVHCKGDSGKEKVRMPEGYRTIIKEGKAEVIDRKSRFLGVALHVVNEEEAMQFLEKTRKKHYEARHNCWAYVLGDDSKNERASDDGEPSGTAGRPILEVIRHAGLTYTFVVVTRYFGGTLLGTGGLVRAYTQAAADAIEDSDTGVYLQTDRIEVTTDYSDVGKLQYLFSQKDIRLVTSDYGENVRQILLCDSGRTDEIRKQITEMTSGRAQIQTESAGFQLL